MLSMRYLKLKTEVRFRSNLLDHGNIFYLGYPSSRYGGTPTLGSAGRASNHQRIRNLAKGGNNHHEKLCENRTRPSIVDVIPAHGVRGKIDPSKSGPRDLL